MPGKDGRVTLEPAGDVPTVSTDHTPHDGPVRVLASSEIGTHKAFNRTVPRCRVTTIIQRPTGLTDRRACHPIREPRPQGDASLRAPLGTALRSLELDATPGVGDSTPRLSSGGPPLVFVSSGLRTGFGDPFLVGRSAGRPVAPSLAVTSVAPTAFLAIPRGGAPHLVIGVP